MQPPQHFRWLLSVLLLSPDIPKICTRCQLPELPITCHFVHSGSGRPPVMGGSLTHLEWEKSDHPAGLHDNNFRCFTSGLQSSLQQNMDQRPLVSSRASTPHQLSETFSNLTSCPDICQSEITILDNTTAVAYINRMGGGDSVTYAIAADQRSMAVVYGEKYLTI